MHFGKKMLVVYTKKYNHFEAMENHKYLRAVPL